MKIFKILTFVFCNFAIASTASFKNLLSHENAQDLIFRKLKNYIYLLEQNSKIQNTRNNCRLYMYFNSLERKVYNLRTCVFIDRSIENEITEKITFSTKSHNKIFIKIKKTGKNLHATPVNDLFTLNFNGLTELENVSLIISDQILEMRSISKKGSRFSQFSLQSKSNTEKFSIRDNTTENFRTRYYKCFKCKENDLFIFARYSNKQEYTRYYDNGPLAEITPYSFNLKLDSLIEIIENWSDYSFSQLLKKYKWPKLESF